MARDRFLEQIADYYIGKGMDLADCCFVFPNKRSAMFMRKYIKERLDTVSFLPKLTTMSNFITLFNDSSQATQRELLFSLYDAYRRVLSRHGRQEQIKEFDSFIFWGDIMLGDFDDIDANLVDAHQLFRNLKNVKEIRSNYLTESQIDVIESIWGRKDLNVDVDNFWKHMPSSPSEDGTAGKFINLWEILGEIYDEFRTDLHKREYPLSYLGMMYRTAYDRICGMGADEFGYRRYAFIGFNAMTTSQALILKRFRDLGIADFFWDISSGEISGSDGKIKKGNKAARFMEYAAKRFPSPDDFSLIPVKSHPDIEIISVPSNVGQTKVVSAILSEWIEKGIIKNGNLIDTAVILPDESLLMPMLYSIPGQVSAINITMGIPYSITPFASLLSSIISMQLRAREIKGVFHYYYEDVIQVLSHPHIDLIASGDAASIKKHISDNRSYNISAGELCAMSPDLAFIFKAVKDPGDIEEVERYTRDLIDTLSLRLKGISSATSNPDGRHFHEIEILDAYEKDVRELCRFIQQSGVAMKEHTFFTLLERSLSGLSVNLSGTPLVGLQVMGFLETRALDFDNVIILSMNERIFPRKQFIKTLIPNSLRSGYGMPTQDYHECDYAYHFYRLLTRAKHVRLLYDSRTAGISSGEMSRYLFQLLHLDTTGKVCFRHADMPASIGTKRKITVNKTPDVIKDLQRFFPGGDLNLSASALKAYKKCPLMFYLQYVKKLRNDDETVNYMDSATYGTIVHKVAESLYLPYKGHLITENVIDTMLHEDIRHHVIRIIDEIYHKSKYSGNLSEVPGEGQILADVITGFIRQMLKSEKKLCDFTFVDAESGGQAKPWKINGKYTINFKMSIDRIDRIDAGTLRFIDYKTGSDELRAPSVGSLFEEDHRNGNDAIFQLLVYCHAYSDIFGCSDNIKPMVYRFKTMATDGILDLKIGGRNGKTIDNYKDLSDGDDPDNDFHSMLQTLIDRIFETDNRYPFRQTTVPDNCVYCPFVPMCGRYTEQNRRI